jgi:hypothetical protein
MSTWSVRLSIDLLNFSWQGTYQSTQWVPKSTLRYCSTQQILCHTGSRVLFGYPVFSTFSRVGLGKRRESVDTLVKGWLWATSVKFHPSSCVIANPTKLSTTIFGIARMRISRGIWMDFTQMTFVLVISLWHRYLYQTLRGDFLGLEKG